jgi:hypothetical protein
MKKYSKVGNRLGKPAYRTPTNFKNKKIKATLKNKIKTSSKKSPKKNLVTISLPIEMLKNIQKNKKLLKQGKINIDKFLIRDK